MIKRTITYPDLDGNQVTEDLYFHFTKAELIEMEATQDISSKFEKIVAGKAEGKEAIFLIRDFVQAAIGKRDGNRFIKNQEIRDEFIQTEAYSNLLLELVGDPAGAALFINELMPKDLQQTVADLEAKAGKASEEVQLPPAPGNMSREELLAKMRERNQA